MLVILDPNVLVSAALSPSGAPAELIRRWLAGEFELLVSPQLLEELARVLNYPKIASRLPQEDAASLLLLLETEADVASDPTGSIPVEVEDPGDEYLVALAIAHRAALVSGDGHLTALADRFPVFSPAGFLLELDRGSTPG